MSNQQKWNPLKTSQQNTINYGAVGKDFTDTEQQDSYPLYPRNATRGRNCKEFASMAAAALIFVCGGISLVYNAFYYKMYHYQYLFWYIMAIIGAAVGAFVTKFLKNQIITLIPSVLILFSGFCQLFDNEDGTKAALSLTAFSFGFMFVPTMILAGEGSPVQIRGKNASFIGVLCFSFGVFLQTIFTSRWISQNVFSENQVHGMFLIIISIMSLFYVFFLPIETPVYFLRRHREREAVECIRHLQRNTETTDETYELLKSLKTYMIYNDEMSLSEAICKSLPALVKLSLLRILVGTSYSFAFSLSGLVFWADLAYAALRLIGVAIGVFLQDSLGRKKPLAFGVLISGVLTICLAIYNDMYFSYSAYYYNGEILITVPYLIILYQFFVGLASASSASYLSEAFPLAIKPYCIAIAFSVELLAQIFWIICDFDMTTISTLSYTIGAFSLVYLISIVYFLPETKKTTLYEAQAKFQSCLSSN